MSGRLIDRIGFAPLFIAAGATPLVVGVASVWMLARRPAAI